MFERTDLETLAAFEGTQPIVSLYLNMPAHLRGTPEAYRARLKSLLRQVNGHAPRPDMEMIERFFDREFDWTGRSAVVFSGQQDNLWKVYQFAVPLRSYIHVGRKPLIAPLADLMDTYGSYIVASLDHQSIRLYHFHLGELVKSEEASGETVRNISASGGNRGAGIVRGQDPMAHKREIVRSNMKLFAGTLDIFSRGQPTALLLAGPEEAVSQFREVLSASWRSRLQGALALPHNASEKEVRERSLEVLQAAQKARQEKLVETIRTAAAKQANGTVGIEPTLDALHAGRVQALALVEGLEAPGFRCTGCGYGTTVAAERCQFCGQPLAQVANAAEHAVRQAIEQGATVEFLEEDTPAARQLDGMGALLRY